MEHISTKEQLDALLHEKEAIVFKHSDTCPVSAEAFEEYKKFVSSNPTIPAVYLVVQEDRELSNYIAETYHVKHQSPQTIIFKNGDVTWHESHWRITQDSLTEAYEQ